MKQAGKWSGRMAEELSGKTLAVLGFGKIGRSLARIAKLGYGMNVVAFDVNEEVSRNSQELFDAFTTDFEEVGS